MSGFAVSMENWLYGEAHKAPVCLGNLSTEGMYYEYKKKGEEDSAYRKIKFGSDGAKDKVLDQGKADTDTNYTELVLDAGDYVLRATIPASDNYAETTAVTGFSVERSKAVP